MKQLERLEAIAGNLSRLPDALGLIGLGSVGRERARLDRFSDLDFFVVVRDGAQEKFLADLAWLDVPEAALSYRFQNTKDGFKVLWGDGLYGEFAVFELAILPSVLAAGAAIIWQRDDVKLDIDFEKNVPAMKPADFYFNEAATNIYVAKLRYQRGERLSAYSFMASAFDNTTKGIAQSVAAQGEFVDKFDKSRRFEQNFPEDAVGLQAAYGHLADFDAQALHLIEIIEKYSKIAPLLKQKIREK